MMSMHTTFFLFSNLLTLIVDDVHYVRITSHHQIILISFMSNPWYDKFKLASRRVLNGNVLQCKYAYAVSINA